MVASLFTLNSSFSMKEYQKILIGVTSMALLLFCSDYVIGKAFEVADHHTKYAIFHRQNYLMNDSNEEILILGSSRANHHYVPSIISDSLGMSCYNAGSNGMCIYYHYAILRTMIDSGRIPKMIIYDVFGLDVAHTAGPTANLEAALDRLAPYYGKCTILDELVSQKGNKERLKMHSRMYRYNSKLVQIIKCMFIPTVEDNGYEVLNHYMQNVKLESTSNVEETLEEGKIHYLKRMIDDCKLLNIKLIFVLSPYYGLGLSLSEEFILDQGQKNGIPCYNMKNEPNLMYPEYFADVMHMNDDGARLFTELLVENLKTEDKQIIP